MPARSGIIFDMDGLLLDTERVARIAWQQAAQEAGYDMTEAVFASLIGRREADSIELLRVAFGPEFDFHKSNARCNAIYEDYVTRHGVPVKDGARELLESLAARKIPLALATSTQSPLAQRRLEQAGLIKFFAEIVTGNQVTHGKPAPDIYIEAVRRLGIDAATSLALEDSHAGVRSAHGAGLRVIMVPDLVPPTPEIAALTHATVKSLDDARELLLRAGPGD
jgi:HAD superfamily hydrolase (TIGR01509 family)